MNVVTFKASRSATVKRLHFNKLSFFISISIKSEKRNTIVGHVKENSNKDFIFQTLKNLSKLSLNVNYYYSKTFQIVDSFDVHFLSIVNPSLNLHSYLGDFIILFITLYTNIKLKNFSKVRMVILLFNKNQINLFLQSSLPQK